MGLNDLHLPNSLVYDLYKKSLYDSADTLAKQTSAFPETTDLKYLGKNQKKILVIVSFENVPYMPDSALEFLTSILKACRLTLADVAIINYVQTGALNYQRLQQDIGYNMLLLFGKEPSSISLPVNFPLYQIQSFDGRSYLYADALTLIEKDKDIKTKLWTCLKKMFGV